MRWTHVELGRSHDRDDVLALSEDPGDSNLSARGTILLSDLLQAFCEVEYGREVLLRETRDEPPEVRRGELLG